MNHGSLRRMLQQVPRRVKVFAAPLGVILIVMAAGGALSIMRNGARAACSYTSDATQGMSQSSSVSVATSGTYYEWVQMKPADTANDSVYMQIDSTCPNLIGGGSTLTAGQWQWVNFANSTPATPTTVSLTAGTHTLSLIGNETALVSGGAIDGNTEQGMLIGRVILTQDPTCIPTGTGDNCTTASASAPTIVVSSPTSGQYVVGKIVPVSTTVTPAGSASTSSVALLVDGHSVQTLTAAPYSFALNTLTLTNGSHVLSINATDNQSHVGSQSLSIIVTNGDTNGDHKINLSDLSIMASHWQQAGQTLTAGDINGDGTVNIQDLAILANNWGQTW